MSRWAAPAPSCGPLLVHQLTTSTSWVVAGMEATAPPLLAQMSPAGQVTALLEERRQGREGQGKHLGEQTRLNAAVSLLWDGDAAQQFLAYVARENTTFQAWGTQVFCYRILQCNTGQQIWIWFMDYCYCFLNMKATVGSPFQEFIISPTAE